MFQAPGLTLALETSEMMGQNNAQRLSGNGSSIFPAIFYPPAFSLVYADCVSGISGVFQKVTFVNCVCSLNQVWLHNVGKHAQYCRHSPLSNRCYSLHPGTGVRFVLQALYTFLQSTTSIAWIIQYLFLCISVYWEKSSAIRHRLKATSDSWYTELYAHCFLYQTIGELASYGREIAHRTDVTFLLFKSFGGNREVRR